MANDWDGPVSEKQSLQRHIRFNKGIRIYMVRYINGSCLPTAGRIISGGYLRYRTVIPSIFYSSCVVLFFVLKAVCYFSNHIFLLILFFILFYFFFFFIQLFPLISLLLYFIVDEYLFKMKSFSIFLHNWTAEAVNRR